MSNEPTDGDVERFDRLAKRVGFSRVTVSPEAIATIRNRQRHEEGAIRLGKHPTTPEADLDTEVIRRIREGRGV